VLTPEEVDRMLKNLGVTKKFLKARFENIPEAIQKKLEGFFKGESFYLYGPVGMGKTYISCALLRRFAEEWREKLWRRKYANGYEYHSVSRPEFPVLASVPQIMLQLRDTFHHNDSCFDTETKIIERFSSKKCILLDDLGVEKPSEFVLQSLYMIVDNRYKNEKHTVFTSNLDLSAIADRIGDRIASRITEMCKVIKLTGKDRRLRG
jgi:DNA replication protein DnaC